jgi:hypothetical protein
VNGVPANNIAARDGWVWRSLGSGTDGPVDCLNTFGGALIVSGEFDRAGGVTVRSVARYANSAWSAMGEITGYNGSSWVAAAGGPC